MPQFTDLDKDSGLGKLNAHLADHSYADGWLPSQFDVTVKAALGAVDGKKFGHVQRWSKHIDSFSAAEQAAWPAAAVVSSSSAAPAATATATAAAAAATPAAPKKAGGDEFSLFDDDAAADEEYEQQLAERAAAANAKRAAKNVVAKSALGLYVKPYDDETDLKKMEEAVRSIQVEGLTWGACKSEAIGYGISKLLIQCVIVDELVSTEDIVEKIEAFEDMVQSVDVAFFNKH